MNNRYCQWSLAAVTVVVLLCALWSSEAAFADNTRFKITVSAVSKRSGGFDSKLNHVKKHLRQLSYNSFKYVSSTGFTLSPGSKREFKIAPGVKGVIKLKWVKNKRAAFNFRMPQAAVDVSYSIPLGGATMVVCPRLKGVNYVIVIQALK